MTTVEEDPDQLQGKAGGRVARPWVAVSIAVLLLAATVAALAWGAAQRSDASAMRDDRDRERAAALTASQFVEELLTYDHEDLDAQQAAVERFATEKFLTDYLDAFTSEVQEQILAEQASSTVSVQEVFVTPGGGDELRAIVHARSEVSSGGGASAELESYLQVTLVRLGDRWRVDELTSLGSRDLSPATRTGANAEEETDG
jgi:Mce-associated membrane protein